MKAGVSGRVLPDPVGQYAYFKWGGRCEVTVFLMEVLEQKASWLEDDFRERTWVTPEKAVKMFSKKDLKKLIRRAAEKLK